MSTLIIYTFVCQTNKTEKVVNEGDYHVTSMIDITITRKVFQVELYKYIYLNRIVSVIDLSF